MSKGASFAAAAGVGAAVFVGWGCGIASADDTAGTSSASDTSSQHDAGPPRDEGVKSRGARAASEGSDRAAGDEPADNIEEADDSRADADEEAQVDEAQVDEAQVDDAQVDDAQVDEPQDDKATVEVDLEDTGADLDVADDSDPVPAPAAVGELLSVTAAARRELDSVVPAPTTATSQTLAIAENSVSYTDEPTFFDHIVVASLYVMRGISGFIGVDVYGLIGKVLENGDPPWFVKNGLDVRRTEFEVAAGNTWDVWEFHPPNPTGKTVIAVHGGGFILEPLVPHWLAYANMARDTGATVIVPMYPLATTKAGTALEVVPAMAQFMFGHITAQGAENVSIYADSAGPSLAMAAVRELILAGKPVPASMVLLSFAPDSSLSNPALYDIKDPIIDVRNLDFYADGAHWSEGVQLTDPIVSPLFFEDAVLAALPPSTIYVGELEWVLPDTLLLQEKWSAAGGVVSTVIGRGQFHDWALGGLSFNSAGPKVRPDIYRQLGLLPSDSARFVTLRVA